MLFFALFCLGVIIDDYNSDDGASWPEPARRAKVPLEAHIMSKCPDAKDCLHDLILPAMQNVSDMVDFTLSYVGESTPYDGVKCMHGQTECLGNMIELCAAHLYPDPKIYLGFTMCLTRDYAEIPKRELVQDCALEHSISMEALNDCLNAEDGGKAVEMLRESFNRTADAGVTKSCTVRLNGEIRCVRDGGKWKECEGGHSPEELVSEIQELAATGLWS
ncbi:hypothetical protein BDY17DRAFT_250669 [Neohortaea acidophila]|uniref:Gamma interferon inducible lysosomal thiol reductase-domain-containing protein n=1 Tax=Neohortaea acidophila TaxID=245834 RepID=A0A6A6PTE4_9PEZI|nr:uncharacterized protein BDY17DRAFT_250669 [Neohortaea acidophila]KAF2483155.1 hypothetical protein BDY17DRAFT_250669 [Neohortaea acidophila]